MEFDPPIFKVLAHNDTGAAAGHQGGIVIPKELEAYFPQISGVISATSPTAERELVAELFAGPLRLSTVRTRYQYQTWGGTRSPERRLTANLGDLRNLATADDILLFEKSALVADYFRLRLIRKNERDYPAFKELVGNRRWGVLDLKLQPISEVALLAAANEIEKEEAGIFHLFEQTLPKTTSLITRVARSRAFAMRVTSAYGFQCVACRSGLRTPTGGFEVEAAHVVPRYLGGTDDTRNGMALCKSHHWAFDEGLWSVADDKAIVVSPKSLLLQPNESLKPLAGRQIALPAPGHATPHLDAIRWHRTYVYLG